MTTQTTYEIQTQAKHVQAYTYLLETQIHQ